jgi:hypothetical protein
VRGRMIIAWGTLINQHIAKQKKYTFNAEQWGTKLMNINWKYILKLWGIRNKEIKGETPTQVESIRRQEMLAEITDISQAHLHLPLFARNLISRDIVSLRDMSTTSIASYLYGARTVAEAERKHGKDLDQRTLKKFIKTRQQRPTALNTTVKNNRNDTP